MPVPFERNSTSSTNPELQPGAAHRQQYSHRSGWKSLESGIGGYFNTYINSKHQHRNTISCSNPHFLFKWRSISLHKIGCQLNECIRKLRNLSSKPNLLRHQLRHVSTLVAPGSTLATGQGVDLLSVIEFNVVP